MMQEVEVLKTIQELICSFFSEEQFTLSCKDTSLTFGEETVKIILNTKGTNGRCSSGNEAVIRTKVKWGWNKYICSIRARLWGQIPCLLGRIKSCPVVYCRVFDWSISTVRKQPMTSLENWRRRCSRSAGTRSGGWII